MVLFLIGGDILNNINKTILILTAQFGAGHVSAANAIKEYILEKNPDFLLVVDRTAAITEKDNNAQKVLDNDIIKQTKAYKEGHVVYLDAANWYLAFGGLESMEIIAQELDRAVKK